MSAFVELYVEKLLARMNLDDAQRVDVEREFRAHLDEAIERAVREGGLPLDEAEHHALIAFGEPSFIARQFGLLNGHSWFVFERVAAMAALILFFGLLAALQWYLAVFLFILPGALYGLGEALWNRVEVNGVLRIHQFFRRTRVIPFDTIRAVRFQKGQVFARTRVVLEYDGGKATVSRRLRGMSAASVALEALCPEAIRPEVLTFLRALRTRIRRETTTFRVGVAVAWAMVAITFVHGAARLWAFQGVASSLVSAYVMGVALLYFQSRLHADRAKAGVCHLLLCLVSVSFVQFYFVLFGPFSWVRPFLILHGLILVSAAAIPWWRGRRQALLLLPAAAVAVSAVAGFFLPPVWSGPIRLVAETPGWIESAHWGASGEGSFHGLITAGSENDAQGYLVEATDGQSTIYSLGGGHWGILPDPTTDTMTLLWSDDGFGRQGGWRAFVYSVGQELREIEPLPVRARLLALQWREQAAWSPTRKYLVTPVVAAGVSNLGEAMELAVTNVDNGVYRLFGRMAAWSWVDDTHLRAMDSLTTPSYRPPYREARYRSWILNAETGGREPEDEHVLDPGFALYTPAGATAALATHVDDRGIGIYNLKTKTLTRLPDQDSERAETHWYYSQSRVVYFSEIEGRRVLVVAGENGVEAELPLRVTQKVRYAKLSPDGTKLLLLIADDEWMFYRGNYSWSVYDIGRERLTRIAPLGAVQSIRLYLGLGIFSSEDTAVARWLPDSRSVAFLTPVTSAADKSPWRPGGKVSVWVADYETWATPEKTRR